MIITPEIFAKLNQHGFAETVGIQPLLGSLTKDELKIFEIERSLDWCGTDWKEMYQVFNMGHRMELYVNESIAQKLIEISQSFEVEAKVVGRVENFKGNKLTITSPYGTFEY